MSSFTDLYSVKPFKTQWRVYVKILKVWKQYLNDAIGQIVSIGDVEILNVGKRQTKRLSMEIRDRENFRLNCVLWGQFAENLESVAQHANDAVIVAVLRFGKLKLYQGVWSVVKCVTMATIMSIDTEFGWCYMSCGACAKKYNLSYFELYDGFMLIFRVMDNTGETKFLLFDQEAKEVVNQTAAQLTQSVNEIQDPDVLPLALSNICGKKFLFKIAIASSNIVFNSDTYKVISIITQSDVVKEFSEISTPRNTPSIKIEEKAHNTLDGK
ncbi:hypothetical protein EUTSA_v10027522mg, partial [Eutrema salsugineum]